MFLIFH